MRCEPVADRAGDREVARPAGALAQGGEPTRAEIDRVERQPERGALLAAAFDQVDVRISDAVRQVDRQRAHIGRGALVLDAHVPGAVGDGRTRRSEAVQHVGHA